MQLSRRDLPLLLGQPAQAVRRGRATPGCRCDRGRLAAMDHDAVASRRASHIDCTAASNALCSQKDCSMFRTSTPIVLSALVCLNCAIAVAADNQTWSVKIVEDSAVLRIAPKTKMKFVCSTLNELQTAGIEEITLSSEAPGTLPKDAEQSYVVVIADGLAQVQVTNDMPKKYVDSVVKALGSAGIDFVNVSKASR